jgi:hypothetical protein
MGSELLQNCVTLINEQHLQRQGWLAVVANLENIAGYVMSCEVILLLLWFYSDFCIFLSPQQHI